MTSINGLHICELADSARTVTQACNVVKMREAGLACLQCHSQCAGVSDMKVGEAGLLSFSQPMFRASKRRKRTRRPPERAR